MIVTGNTVLFRIKEKMKKISVENQYYFAVKVLLFSVKTVFFSEKTVLFS